MPVQRSTKKLEAQTVTWSMCGDKPVNNHGSVPAWTHPVRRIALRSTLNLSTHVFVAEMEMAETLPITAHHFTCPEYVSRHGQGMMKWHVFLPGRLSPVGVTSTRALQVWVTL
eukprot:1142245-Pelagomonas_calceolata.AAC.3